MGEVKVVEALEASCKGGRRSAQTPGTLWGDHLQSWGGEEVGSWGEVLGSPVAQEVLGKAGAQGTGSKSWEAERVEVEGTA